MEAPDGLEPGGAAWERIADTVRAAAPDVLVTNEMPFGPWLAEDERYDADAGRRSIALHEAGLAALADLHVPAVLSSRPVPAGDRLANEAFVLARGAYRPVHHKHYFPAEPGFHETAWFKAERPGFDTVALDPSADRFRAGFLLCTELFFNEWARHYRRQGAALIAAPRAAETSVAHWHVAAAMAAIVSGAYVVSSNRSGYSRGGQVFGGRGFAFAPDGTLLAEASPERPVVVFDLDLDWVARRRDEYPCYVSEISG
jgi:N-carbamoylputrescine amidase